MNKSTSFVFPSKEDPKIIGLISIWNDGRYFRTEVFAATYLGEGKSRLEAKELSAIREDYFDTSLLADVKISEDDGYAMQYGAAITRLKSIILENHDVINYNGNNWDPILLGDEKQVIKYGIIGFKKMIADRTSNSKLRVDIDI
jgi:hypothetical protein